MQGIAKATLCSIFIALFLLVLSSFIYFFPWYTTLVVETFNVSQIVAGDNYLKESYYQEALEHLNDTPLFDYYQSDSDKCVQITVKNESNRDAIGVDDETYYETMNEEQKPYGQRGRTLTVTIRATYPLKVRIMGNDYAAPITLTCSLKTVGLKHYKDLEYYFD